LRNTAEAWAGMLRGEGKAESPQPPKIRGAKAKDAKTKRGGP